MGEDLVYRKRKKISDVKKYTKTINPNTPGQQTQKGYFQSAILAWQTDGYSSIDIRAWDIYARAKKVKASGFNMFTRFKIDAAVGSKTWERLTNCNIYDVTGAGFKVDINVDGDYSGKLYFGTSKLYMPNEVIGVFAVNKYTFDVTGLSNLTGYYFFIKNTLAGKEGRTGIYEKSTTEYVPPPIPIDVGSEAKYRSNLWDGNRTYINKNNPANATGKITTVQIYTNGYSFYNIKIGTFYEVSPNHFTARESQAVANCFAPGFHERTVDLNIVEGDYIGIFWIAAATLRANYTGGSGIWKKSGDYMNCENEEFSFEDGDILSLYGIGSS